jgi:peptidoglycan hydrolase-like protein with peptidoglycan-binding domain
VVAAVQMELRVLGLYPQKPDGTLGPKTIRAVEIFERTNGLTVTGDPKNPIFQARLVEVIEKTAEHYPSAFAFSN